MYAYIWSKFVFGVDWILTVSVCVFRPGFHFGAPQKHKVMTKSTLYKRYREILFQKVALGYLLHFVQNGSSNNILNNVFCTTISNIWKLHGSASIWEHQQNIKLWQKHFYINDSRKSSSRKLRWAIYYTSYRMDLQQTY